MAGISREGDREYFLDCESYRSPAGMLCCLNVSTTRFWVFVIVTITGLGPMDGGRGELDRCPESLVTAARRGAARGP